MTVRCNALQLRARHSGAALVTALTMIAAVAVLSAAVMRDVTLETAMTRNFAAQVRARQAAFSAIETVLADAAVPAITQVDGILERNLRVGPDAQFTAAVTVRYLGTTTLETAQEQGEAGPVRYFEITAAVRGTRNVRHRRRLYLRIAD